MTRHFQPNRPETRSIAWVEANVCLESVKVGIDSQQVLEMSNFGPAPLEVYPGTAICQFVFQELDGNEQYEGRFAGQTEESF